MRCFKAITAVSPGSGTSSRRSGIEVVNRTVICRVVSADDTREAISGSSSDESGLEEYAPREQPTTLKGVSVVTLLTIINNDL
jgi:hypothetical protein